MKSYTTAALLSLSLVMGCADRGDKNAEAVDQNKTATATEPATPPAPAPADNRAAVTEGQGEPSSRVESRTEGASATTGSRPRSTATNRPAARSTDTAPRTSAAGSADTNAAPTRRAAEWREITIPAGTALPLELETALSSETAQIETPVRARLKQALSVDGYNAIPAGAILTGEVTEVERAGKIKGRSRLAFTFNRLQADNVREDVQTNPLTFEGDASKGEDATKVGAGAVGGAIVGGILGGGKGAAKGAAIGGAAGTGVVLATRGKDVKLSSGMDLAASLAAPLILRVPAR